MKTLNQLFAVVSVIAVLISISLLTKNVRDLHRSYLNESNKTLVCKQVEARTENFMLCKGMTDKQLKGE